MDIAILYEDEQIVVIDKPSGLIVNRAETVAQQTVQDWFVEKFQIPNPKFQTNSSNQILNGEDYFLARGGLVHRLDKETSGVMVLAKTASAFVELLRQFKEREVQKTYLGLTHGIWKSREGEISLPIGRRRDNRQRMGVREDGRESVTGYKVITEYQTWQFPNELHVDERGYSGFSMVEFAPKTGRTHQIRVHARHVGHPLVGDKEYAGRKRSREDRKWAPRVMLQAQTLEFTLPKCKDRVKFTSKQELMGKVSEYLTNVTKYW